jgi:poly[(R)-3-hydroxyalkanoate] polymerase subunit PhaC
MNAAVAALARAHFAAVDVVRRAQADAYRAFGLGPSECAYRVLASGPHWRLRDYGGGDTSPPLLIVAAPIKRPYIWDLCPSASAIRLCLRHPLHVYLIEWTPASPDTGNNGLDEYASAIGEGVAKVAGRSGTKLFLAGHSLGGTLAAIYAASAPERIGGLILLAAPLCFQPASSRFRDALVSLIPPALSEDDPCPGSLLSQVSALASPDTFVWSRLLDAARSAGDSHAMEVHARAERWALDEAPLPGKLVHQIVEWLYREDRLFRGTLKIGETTVGPLGLSMPTLAVVNKADDVAPADSASPFLDASSAQDVRMIEVTGEVGVCLQHLGILVGRKAHARVWPQIMSWIDSHS